MVLWSTPPVPGSRPTWQDLHKPKRPLRDAFHTLNTILSAQRPLRDTFLPQNTILSAQKAPAGRISNPKYNPNTLRAARRPCLHALAIPAPPPSTRDATVSFLLTRAMGPKGIKWDPRGGPKGAFGALWRDGPRGPFGVIPKPFRMEGHFEWKVWKVITNGRPFRYQSHFKAE